MAQRQWYVYIIKASDESLYTGITVDLNRRLVEHQEGKVGAKYFRGRHALGVVYSEDNHNRSSASKREAEIKKLTRKAKLELIDSIIYHL
jgi:putative endonuclease